MIRSATDPERMLASRRLAACLALGVIAACAGRSGAGSEAREEPGALARLLDLPPAQRGAAIADFVRAARPRVRVEVVPRETIEAAYGALLPIGLEDFEILHVAVELDDPAVVIGPAVALTPDAPAGARPLPLYAPTRDLFLAFTGERRAGTSTRYRLKSAGLPWLVNILTVGVLEVMTLEVEGTEVQPTEQDHARAAPRATRLAELVSPPHGCARGRSPCDRYLVVPRPRADVPLRIDLDLDLGDTFAPALRMSWSAPLPAGKPLAARLDDLFHGAPIALEGARVEPAHLARTDADRCRLREPLCTLPTAARASTAPPPPPIPAPARLATPAESLAARPPWGDDDNYAPGTTIDAVDPEALVPGGALRDVLLICDLRTRDDSGTLVVEARAGAHPVHHPTVVAHGDGTRFVVPLVQLDPGDTLTISASRRTSSWFWGVSDTPLGRAALVYRGALPLASGARGLGVSCVALGRDGVEAQVTARMNALAEQLADFDLGVDPIVESSSDWGLGAWGMTGLRRRVEAIAGLVGWSDPRISALLPALEHYHDVFRRHLGRFLAAQRDRSPAPGALLSFREGDLRVVGHACGDAVDRRKILWSREKAPRDGCVTIVEVSARDEALDPSPRTGSLGAVWRLELAWADGRRSDAWSVGGEPPPGKRRDLERLHLAPGESARFYLAPREPYHRQGQAGPLFLLALDSLDPVYIRLQ